MRVLVVDDEALARRGLQQLLAQHDDATIVGECRDGLEALDALQHLRPDVIFLDVQMPELDGFGVMHQASERAEGTPLPLVVFLTAYEEFALDAFGVEAVDYLVKPVTDARFRQAMDRVRRRLAGEARGAQQLVIPSGQVQRVVRFEEIDWIGAEDYYAAVHTAGRRHLLRESLASLESRLDPREFVRVHRQAMVNVSRILETRVVDGEMHVILRDGTRLPVSRRRRAALAAVIQGT